METEALSLARTRRARSLPERLRYGPVELSVTDLAGARELWTSVLGFVPRAEPGSGFALGTAERTLIVLPRAASIRRD